MKWLMLIWIPLVLGACGNRTEKEPVDSTAMNAQVVPSVQPLVQEDSLQLVYYKKPFLDKERYTRFFRTVSAKDTVLGRQLKMILSLPGAKQDSIRPCYSEGKVLIPLKGDAFQVIYFSRMEAPCRYLYLIRDGAFYYYEMDALVEERLNDWEKFSKEP